MMVKYEEPSMEILEFDFVGTLVDISGGGNDEQIPGTRSTDTFV